MALTGYYGVWRQLTKYHILEYALAQNYIPNITSFDKSLALSNNSLVILSAAFIFLGLPTQVRCLTIP